MNKWLLLLLLFPTAVRANQITPQFTQGSMQATTTTTQVVTEVIDQEVFGGAYSSWSGPNVVPSGDITMEDVEIEIKGEDNLGNVKIMNPGKNYKFPGKFVMETPTKE